MNRSQTFLTRLGVPVLLGFFLVMPWVANAANLSTAQRLERLELRIEKVTDLTLQLDALRSENRKLRGEIEVLQHAMRTMKQKQRDLYLDVDQRLSQLQSPGPYAASSETPSSDAGASSDVSTSPDTVPDNRPGASNNPDPARAEAEYQAAYDLLRPEQRRYPEAIAAFRGFLQKYPENQLAANAQYWLAEASYVTQDNATALVEFQKVVDRYPYSLKVPGALLKIGYIAHAAGDMEKAKEILSQVVGDYGGSASADMAQQRLQRIEREAR